MITLDTILSYTQTRVHLSFLLKTVSNQCLSDLTLLFQVEPGRMIITSNCRGKEFGDMGKMFRMGKRFKSKEYAISKNNQDGHGLMAIIGW